MSFDNLINDLKGSHDLREEFFYNPERVAKKYNISLSQEQLDKLSLARKLEEDPLLNACMCPRSSGVFSVVDKKDKKVRSLLSLRLNTKKA